MAVQIRVEQFCALATSPQWQAWLYRYDATIYQELADHLRTSKGCGANRDKMVVLLSRINATAGGPEKLVEFLSASFPHVLDRTVPVEPTVTHAEPIRPTPSTVPFERYNPRTLTFPRRLILDGGDIGELTRKAQLFVSDKVRSDWVVTAGRAYIEFIPQEHSGVAHQIPDKSWLVTIWKRENGR